MEATWLSGSIRTTSLSGVALAFDITGRAMKGWVMIPKTSLQTPDQFRRWLDKGLAFAKSLPNK
jgi:hypothetical protein